MKTTTIMITALIASVILLAMTTMQNVQAEEMPPFNVRVYIYGESSHSIPPILTEVTANDHSITKTMDPREVDESGDILVGVFSFKGGTVKVGETFQVCIYDKAGHRTYECVDGINHKDSKPEVVRIKISSTNGNGSPGTYDYESYNANDVKYDIKSTTEDEPTTNNLLEQGNGSTLKDQAPGINVLFDGESHNNTANIDQRSTWQT